MSIPDDAAPLRRRRFLRRAARTGLYAVAALLALAGGVRVWYYHRPMPGPARDALFPGVTYTRDVMRQPRPAIAHVVTIDLHTPGLGFLVTPGDPRSDRPLRARTTTQFLRQAGVQIAINGDFFYPWWSHAPWSYYPHVGDPVTVSGFAVSRGVAYGPGARDQKAPALHITRDNRASFRRPVGGAYNALSGYQMVLERGELSPSVDTAHLDLNPRTAVGLDREGRTLLLMVVDGRQPNYSEGVTVVELAGILERHGAYEALNLDGGGSSTLAVEQGGRVRVLNCPIDNRIPGRERPVANHLGVLVPVGR